MAQLTQGDLAPDFALTDADGRAVSLSDFAGSRVILYFYPAALTPGCSLEAVDFNAAMADLAKAGYQVVGISPDLPAKLDKFRSTQGLGFPLLSDPERTTLDAYGAYGTKSLYGKLISGVIRSTFVIDVDAEGKGTVELAQYNVRATGHVARLRRELGV